LRVLLTNITLASRTGTEVNTRDIALGLVRRGHQPVVYSPDLGEMAREIRAATVPVVDDLAAVGVAPDVIHGHHHTVTLEALLRFPGVPGIYFVHDWEVWYDAPLRFPRVVLYAPVDTANADRVVLEGGVPPDDVRLILNAVDTERFRRRPPLPVRPARALVFNNRASEANLLPLLREACARTGLGLTTVGALAGTTVARPEELLGGFDMVFARGRCALEAMAVGAAVVLCGHDGTGPLVTAADFDRLRPLNFGRRALDRPLTVESLVQEIGRYDATDAERVTLRVREEASLERQLDRLLEVYEEAIVRGRTLGTDTAAEARATAGYFRDWAPRYQGIRAASLLQARVAELEADWTRLASELAGAAAERDRLRAELASASAQLADTRAQLALMTATATWRLRRRLLRSPGVLDAYRWWLTVRDRPASLPGTAARMRLRLPLLSRKSREMRRVFTAIHAARAWGECESASGPGSTRERAASFLPDLIELVRSLRVHTLLDAPCGDFNWAQPLAEAVERYIGVDVVPALVELNLQHASPRRRFLCRDLVRQRLPTADLVLCRDALVHFAQEDIFQALANFRRTGAEYLLTTTFVGERPNPDITTGDWRPLNLQRPPFSFPAPLAQIDERCHHTGGLYADKRLALWTLRDLPLGG
jgi:methyltransferase family protein